MAAPPPLSGRGTDRNPENRYERIHVEPDTDPSDVDAEPAPQTVFYRDTSKTVLAENESPDVGFRFSLNPYRGCEHGCIYCYARPTHEYLSFSAGLDFETRIMVKADIAERLREALHSPSWEPQTIALSGNTDCYQPAERRLRLTRACLEVLCEFRNPVGVITKSALVTRDLDVLSDLARDDAAHVFVSITTLDPGLARQMEPRAATPAKRLDAIAALSAAGIPAGAMIAPIIPGLNDSEIPAILERAAAAGARSASWTLVRLPRPVDALFTDWLTRHFPERQVRVLGRIRECRDGRISDAQFGRRMRGEGVYAQHIAALFRTAARRQGLDQPLPALNTGAFRRPPRAGEQLKLLD